MEMKSLARSAAKLYRRGEYQEVEQVCQIILAEDPSNARIWHIRGLAAMQLEEFETASEWLRNAAQDEKERPDALINLGAALLILGQIDAAAATLEEALTQRPDSADARQNLATCYFNLERLDEAEASAATALHLRANWSKNLELLARIHLKKDELEKAAAFVTAALGVTPVSSSIYRVAGALALRQKNFPAAITWYGHAIAHTPDDANLRGNRAHAFARNGDLTEAIAEYRVALALKPDEPDTRYSLGTLLLMLGHFEEGWPLYSARHFLDRNRSIPIAHPILEKLPQEGEKIVAVLDQGVGDQILQASLIPDVLGISGDTTIYCDKRLVPLFARSFPGARFREQSADAAIAASIGLMDMARWLRPSFTSFPKRAGHLRSDPALTANLKTAYRNGTKKPLVGISWSTIGTAKFTKEKSIDLAEWGPILSVPGLTFVNLQYGASHTEASDAACKYGAQIVSDLNFDPVINLDAFTAQVAALDLVITTSNTTAHVAGALNVPTWVFVPVGFGGIWHWFTARTDSPWYSSVRLFRQTTRGDWHTPLQNVAEELSGLFSQWDNDGQYAPRTKS